jgi:hypothetical protein
VRPAAALSTSFSAEQRTHAVVAAVCLPLVLPGGFGWAAINWQVWTPIQAIGLPADDRAPSSRFSARSAGRLRGALKLM